MTRRRIRKDRYTNKRSGKYTEAVSRSSGGVFLHKDMREDPNTGEWRHKSEIDPFDPGPDDIPFDNLIVSPVLVHGEQGEYHLDPFTHGAPSLHLQGPFHPDLIYEKHIQHPEDHFYIWRSILSSVPPNINTENPMQDISSISETNDLDGNREISVPIITQDREFYLVIAIHHSRPFQSGLQFRSFNIGRPNNIGIDQKGLFTQSRDAIIYNETYHTYITNRWMNMFFNENDNNYYWRLT